VAALQSWLRVALPGPAAAADHAAGRRGGGFVATAQPPRCGRRGAVHRLPSARDRCRQQQYDFQTEKHRRRSAGEPLEGDLARGFRTSGLFALARHPNFAAEQAIWCAFYLFGVAATGRWLNWSVLGVVLLILLFQGSTEFTEKISLGKYPEYAEYRRRVPRFLPRPWARRPVF
jgi:hypothetical protein